MKALKNHVILFDAKCPMCKVYTQAFVKTGMLDVDGRTSYQHLPEAVCPLIDRQRAVNEIALVNTQNGEVTYGVNSLFKVIGNSFPFLNFLFRSRSFCWLMSKVYAFISYNRRVIVPAAATEDSSTIQPSFKLHYRLAYLLFTWIATGFILTKYALLIRQAVPAGNSYREYLICGGQLFFQGLVISFLDKKQIWTYLGNMMTISFAGSLLLAVPLLLNRWISIPVTLSLLYFLGVVCLMLLEHLRRCKLLHLGIALSVTWVVYRLLVLVLIYKFNGDAL